MKSIKNLIRNQRDANYPMIKGVPYQVGNDKDYNEILVKVQWCEHSNRFLAARNFWRVISHCV